MYTLNVRSSLVASCGSSLSSVLSSVTCSFSVIYATPPTRVTSGIRSFQTRRRPSRPASPGLAAAQQLQDLALLVEDPPLLLEHLQLPHVHRVQRGQREVVGLGACVLAGGDDVLAD